MIIFLNIVLNKIIIFVYGKNAHIKCNYTYYFPSKKCNGHLCIGNSILLSAFLVVVCPHHLLNVYFYFSVSFVSILLLNTDIFVSILWFCACLSSLQTVRHGFPFQPHIGLLTTQYNIFWQSELRADRSGCILPFFLLLYIIFICQFCFI